MDEIEVVIKIPKILYAQIQSDAEIMIYSGMRSWKGVLATLLRNVRNGTPLPKGHGKIGDLDALRCENTDFDTYNDYCIMFDEIEAAETIIGADKLESKDKE